MNQRVKLPVAAVVKSADRTIDLLELLADLPEAPTFSQLAATLGIPKSSLSQLLANLVARGYIDFDRNRSVYRLGGKIERLARSAASEVPFEQILIRSMEKLRDHLNESVAFYVHRGNECEVIAAVASRHALVFTMTIGDRAPLYSMSAGKIILSWMSSEKFNAYLSRVALKKLATRTIQSKLVLRKEIEAARKNKIAYACEEFEVGIRGMAIPISMGDQLIGALNVAVPIARYNEQVGRDIKSRLAAASAEIGEALKKYDIKKVLKRWPSS